MLKSFEKIEESLLLLSFNKVYNSEDLVQIKGKNQHAC